MELLIALIGVALYSGPILPLAALLLLNGRRHRHHRRNLVLLIILTGIQSLCFLPFIIAVITGSRDALHGLICPFASGLLLFLGSMIYLFVGLAKR